MYNVHWEASYNMLFFTERTAGVAVTSTHLQQLVPGHRRQLLQHGPHGTHRGAEARELLVYLLRVVLGFTLLGHCSCDINNGKGFKPQHELT